METIRHNDILLAIIDSVDNMEPGLSFYTTEAEDLQVAQFRYLKGKILRDHRHIKFPREIERTQEILIVFKGSVEVRTFAMTGKELVDTRVLKAGDFYISLRGGVGYTVLEDDSRMLEVKAGNYRVGFDPDAERELL